MISVSLGLTIWYSPARSPQSLWVLLQLWVCIIELGPSSCLKCHISSNWVAGIRESGARACGSVSVYESWSVCVCNRCFDWHVKGNWVVGRRERTCQLSVSYKLNPSACSTPYNLKRQGGVCVCVCASVCGRACTCVRHGFRHCTSYLPGGAVIRFLLFFQ